MSTMTSGRGAAVQLMGFSAEDFGDFSGYIDYAIVDHAQGCIQNVSCSCKFIHPLYITYC